MIDVIPFCLQEVKLIGIDSLGFDLRLCAGAKIESLRFAFSTRVHPFFLSCFKILFLIYDILRNRADIIIDGWMLKQPIIGPSKTTKCTNMWLQQQACNIRHWSNNIFTKKIAYADWKTQYNTSMMVLVVSAGESLESPSFCGKEALISSEGWYLDLPVCFSGSEAESTYSAVAWVRFFRRCFLVI